MNWTASLLRNELNKQKKCYEERINLLTQTSIDAQNFLELEEKIKSLNEALKTKDGSFAKFQRETKTKEKSLIKQLKDKQDSNLVLEKQAEVNKELFFQSEKHNRELNLYHRRKLREIGEKHQIELTSLRQQISDLQKQLDQEKYALVSVARKKIKSSKEFNHLQTQQEKEITELKNELQSANEKMKSLEKILDEQINKISLKNVITKKSKELRESLLKVKEMMGWETEIKEQ